MNVQIAAMAPAFLGDAMNAINDSVADIAGTVWVLPVLFFLCIADGFFPPLPSESVVVALAAISLSTGSPPLWAVILVAGVGAIIGDNIAYVIGRTVGTERFKWMRRPRVQRTFRWARSELDRRGALLIFTARYIPVGRVAVNMTAGATGYDRRRFVILTIMAGMTWAVYSVGIGVVAGSWVEDNHLLAATVAIIIAVGLGMIVDRITHIVSIRRHGHDDDSAGESVDTTVTSGSTAVRDDAK